jgi:GT2 family glycosyltransferase
VEREGGMTGPTAMAGDGGAPRASTTLSVLICTHRRPDGLARMLASLMPQLEGPPDREIIVVNDGTDGPDYAAALRPFAARIRYHPSPQNLGIAGARNLSASLATGDYLVFTDDDCVAPPHWLDWLAARLESYPELDVVAGTTRPLELETAGFVGRVQACYGLLPRPDEQPGGETLFVTACLAVRGTLFRALGGFNTDPFFPLSGEDSELSARIHRHGARVLVDADWNVRHALARSLRSELRRYRRYGYSNGLIAGEATAPRAFARLRHRRRKALLDSFWGHYRRYATKGPDYPGGRISRVLARLAASAIIASYDLGCVEGSEAMRRRRAAAKPVHARPEELP